MSAVDGALVSITEAAAANGKSVALLRLRCGEGRIKGAVRIGNRWAVPAGDLIILPPVRPRGRPRAQSYTTTSTPGAHPSA